MDCVEALDDDGGGMDDVGTGHRLPSSSCHRLRHDPVIACCKTDRKAGRERRPSGHERTEPSREELPMRRDGNGKDLWRCLLPLRISDHLGEENLVTWLSGVNRIDPVNWPQWL